MPVRDWLTPYYYSLIPGWPRQIFNFFLFFVALAYTSKLVRWLLQVGRMKEWVAGRGRWLKQQADWWR
jgi:hypothetical protein